MLGFQCISHPRRWRQLCLLTRILIMSGLRRSSTSPVGSRCSVFSRQPTRLVDGADPEYKNLDGIILEGTYATEDHPVREGLEKEFVEKVTEVVEGGGTVLVPAFGVGRSQELLSILSAFHFEHPVFVDG